MDGRVKTLHPRLYAGMLARPRQRRALSAAAEHAIEPVDLVCVNLYPFERTVARGDAAEQEIIENIDIGGPTMIRAAAKNHAFAAVVVDPADYAAVLAELRGVGRSPVAGHPRAPGRARRSRAPPATTPPSPTGSRPASGEDFPAQLVATPTRRSSTCATARTRISRPPTTRRSARRSDLLAACSQLPRQGALVQQPARPRLRPRARRRLRRARLRDRQAQQPLRLRGRRRRASTPTGAPSRATR